MKKSARLLSLLLLCAMLASLMSFPVSADEGTADKWDGETKTDFRKSGDGTAEKPFLISTGAELKWLSYYVNYQSETDRYAGKYYKLTNDIDLGGYEWQPIGNTSYEFKGVFMGNGKTIYNLKPKEGSKYCGLFGAVQNAEICQLNIENSTIKSTSTEAAGGAAALVGEARGAKICNVHVKNTDVSSTYRAGGIVGVARTGDCEIVGCSFEGGSIISENYAGGILGATFDTNITVKISGCRCAAGKVEAKYAGGITLGSTGSTRGTVKISDCFNSAVVQATSVFNKDGNAAISAVAGGIVGNLQTDTSTVERCCNIGSVSVPAGYSKTLPSYVSGIVGANNYNVTTSAKINVTKCFNGGAVTAGETNSVASQIAGNTAVLSGCGYISETESTVAGVTAYADDAALLAAVNTAFAGNAAWKTGGAAYPTLKQTHLCDDEGVKVCHCVEATAPNPPTAADFADIDAVVFAGTDETSKIISKLDEESGEEIGYSVGDVTEKDGKYYCEVTLNDASLYVLDGYTTDGFVEGKDKVLLAYKNGEWVLAEGGAAQIAVTKILTVSFNVGSHTNAVFAPVASMQPVNGKVTLPAAPVNSGSWVYVFRGWSDDNGATWMKPGTEYTVTADVELTAVWRLASLTGDTSWNFRDAMSIMDHIDNSKAFEFCPEQLAIANFDLDKRGTINYRDAMAIMSWADHSLTVFPFPDESPVKP